jgi:bifunctional non-homologous end joining protein LigD
VDQGHFFEKNATQYRPEWVKTVPVWSEGNRRNVNYILANDLPTLIWVANLASIELHPSLSRAQEIQCPAVIAFDLDPGPPANIIQCCQVAFWLREIFERFGLQSFPKTSGSKGLQIYVPLNTRTSYDVTKPFAHALARLLEDEHRGLVVSDMKKAIRTNKVFVDWSQNDEHKTTVSVYSLRARERPTVSTPVTWEEVEAAFKKKDLAGLTFEAPQVLQRAGRCYAFTKTFPHCFHKDCESHRNKSCTSQEAGRKTAEGIILTRGSIFRGHIWLGVSELEAGLLSSEARAEKFSRVLFDPAEHG